MKSHTVSLFIVHKPLFPHLESYNVIFLVKCSFMEIKMLFWVCNFDIVEKWVCYRLNACVPPKSV